MATDPSIVVAAITVIGAVASPVLLAHLMNRNARASRQQLYDRQDELAENAARAVEEVARQAKEAARLLAINNKIVAETAQNQSNQLAVIHTLVNSQLTATLQAELDATVRGLASLKEISELKRIAGHLPDREAVVVIASTESRIGELRAQLADRLSAAGVVEKQLDAQANKGAVK